MRSCSSLICSRAESFRLPLDVLLIKLDELFELLMDAVSQSVLTVLKTLVVPALEDGFEVEALLVLSCN